MNFQLERTVRRSYCFAQDPREICVELKECDQASVKTIQQLQISTSENILSVSGDTRIFDRS